MQTQWTEKMTADTIREAIIAEVFHRDRLYVSLLNTEWKHFEDEQQYLRADGAVDTLLDLARKLGLSRVLSGAEAEGRQKLREYMQDRRKNGPGRLEQIRARLEQIEYEVPMEEYLRDSNERAARGYYELRSEKLLIVGDLEIAEMTIRYLDGDDIELG